MKADRLIRLILLLQVKGTMTAKDLAERFEVSERTIYRDIDDISSFGVPIYVDRGRNGGIRLDGDFQTTLTGLSDNDISYFSLPVPKNFIEDLGIVSPDQDSYFKLLSTASDDMRNSLINVSNLVYVDMESWTKETYSTNKEVLMILQHAVWNSFITKLVYEKRDGIKAYTLKPLALVLKRSVWYLVADDAGVYKNFRVDRMVEVDCSENKFERPSKFSLSDHWDATVKKFRKELPKYEVYVRVSHDVYRDFKRRKSLRIKATEEFEDHVEMTLIFDIKHEAIDFMFGIDEDVTVIGPDAFISGLVARAKAILEKYGEK